MLALASRTSLAVGKRAVHAAPAATAPAARRSGVWRRPRVAAPNVVAVSARLGGLEKGDVQRPKDMGVVERAGWNRDRDSGSTAVLERPESGDGVASGSGGRGGGAYRLLLLDSPSHNEGRVVSGICSVVSGVDEARARNCFETSRVLGVALVTSCLREHAEFYRQQLYLRGLKTAIEPDTTTV